MCEYQMVLHTLKKHEYKIICESPSLAKTYVWDGGNVNMNEFSYLCFHFHVIVMKLKMYVAKIFREETQIHQIVDGFYPHNSVFAHWIQYVVNFS